jgi:hypothetical protein
MTTDEPWSYTVLFSGGSSHLRQLSLPFAEVLEAGLPDRSAVPPIHRTSASPLFLEGRHRNELSALEALAGVLLFLSTWGAKRILDDIYEVKIRPGFRALLGENLPRIEDANRPSFAPPKHYCAVLAIWHERTQKAVVVAVIGTSAAEILAGEESIVQVHLEAEQLLDREPSPDPVLLYVVEAGQTTGAMGFDRLEQVIEYLSRRRNVATVEDLGRSR